MDNVESTAAALFRLTKSSISELDIRAFCPADPGYEDYVKLWVRILETGIIPNEPEFDLTEVISLTAWSDPQEFVSPDKFKEFRRFTSSVATVLISRGNDSESVRPANYLARDLLIDVSFNEKKHFNLVNQVLEELRSHFLRSGDEPEYPFLSLALLILAYKSAQFHKLEPLAAQLVSDEANIQDALSFDWQRVSDKFLFGLTVYNQVNHEWIEMVTEIRSELLFDRIQISEHLRLVIDSILDN